jgi:cell division protease FtsH
MESQKKTPQMPKVSRIWWLVLIGLMAWNIWMLRPVSRPEANLPYSAFLEQARAGNVTSVQIAGSQITGKFAKSIAWPLPTPDATPAASSQPAPTPQVYTTFLTTFPETVGDPNLLPLLENQGVEVNVTPPPNPLLSALLANGLPLLLLVLVMVWMGRQATRGQSGIFSFGRSKPRQHTGDHPDVTFKDVAGADEAKADLQEVVDFLSHPKKYHDLGARIPRGIGSVSTWGQTVGA